MYCFLSSWAVYRYSSYTSELFWCWMSQSIVHFTNECCQDAISGVISIPRWSIKILNSTYVLLLWFPRTNGQWCGLSSGVFFLLFSCQPCRKNSQAAGDLRHLDAHVTSLKSVLIKAVSRIRHWLLLSKYISCRNTYETHYDYWMRCLDSSGRAEAVISSLIVRKSIKLDGWWTQNTATKDNRFYSKSVKRDTSANKILDELVSYDIKRYGCDDTHLPFAFYSTVIY